MTTTDQGIPPETYRQPLYKRVLSVSEIGVLVAVVVFFVIFTVANKSMANPENLVRMALQGSFLGLAAFAMGFLMIAGEIDLSSGGTAALERGRGRRAPHELRMAGMGQLRGGAGRGRAGGAAQRLHRAQDPDALVLRHPGHQFPGERPGDLAPQGSMDLCGR